MLYEPFSVFQIDPDKVLRPLILKTKIRKMSPLTPTMHHFFQFETIAPVYMKSSSRKFAHVDVVFDIYVGSLQVSRKNQKTYPNHIDCEIGPLHFLFVSTVHKQLN
mmetsp:Transcript_495/g.1045  ORF Transcript_495/g.1045 Transcript_495/m.1045 type:complete len:106 (-) Transcript_495:10-327(-)